MIVLTGGNGRLGRIASDKLEQAYGPKGFRISVRDPQGAADRAARGIEVRLGDFDKPETLPHAFDGAEQLILISADGMDEDRKRRHFAAIDAAKAAGVRHVIFTSSIGLDRGDGGGHGEMLMASENRLRESGMDWTILRNNTYPEMLLLFAELALKTGAIRLPAGDGRGALISRHDIAEVIVLATGPGFERNRAVALAGAEAKGYQDLAKFLSDYSGKPIAYENVSPDESVRWMEGGLPVPPHYLPFIAQAAVDFSHSSAAYPTPDFRELTGRDPEPAEQAWRRFMDARQA